MSAPLAKTDEIVLIGGQDRTTGEVSRLCGTLPPAVQALTGVDITGVGDHDPVKVPLPSTHHSLTRKPPIKLESFHMH